MAVLVIIILIDLLVVVAVMYVGARHDSHEITVENSAAIKAMRGEISDGGASHDTH